MNERMQSRKGRYLFLAECTFILFLVGVLSLCVGAYHVSPDNIVHTIYAAISGAPVDNPYYEVVILDVRIPRILLAVAIGAGLSVAGCVYQGVFRNPLVEPYLLGVSSGAAFGAALAIVLGFRIVSLQVTALLFSLAAVFCVYSLAKSDGKTPLLNLILIGIVVNALFSAGISFLKTIAHSEQLRDLTFWLMGGLYVAEWNDVIVIIPVILVLFVVLWAMAWRLNILSLGDSVGQTLGIDVQQTRALFIFFSTIIASLTVATVGIIAWIGLIIPHIGRMVVGPDHRVLIPVSALFGGIFLLICDTFARNLTSGEVPISILTSLIAAPYIIYLVRKNKAYFFG